MQGPDRERPGGSGPPLPAAATAAAAAKPKRPLSAYNLFYRYKRQKVLAAIARGGATRASVLKIIEKPPGLEDVDDRALDHVESPSGQMIVTCLGAPAAPRRAAIRTAMEGRLLPRDTRARSHRKDAMMGLLSFVELGKIMNASWKSCDAVAREAFRELAEEGREAYNLQMQRYHATARGAARGKAAKAMLGTRDGEGSREVEAARAMVAASKRKREEGPSPASSAVSESDGEAGEKTSAVRKKSEYQRRQADLQRQLDEMQQAKLKEMQQAKPTARPPMPLPHAMAPSAPRASLPGTAARPSPGAPPPRLLDLLARPPAPPLALPAASPGAPSLPLAALPTATIAGLASLSDAALRSRIRDLEAELAEERLRSRIRELEARLASQRGVEGRLRAHLGVVAGTPSSSGAISGAPMPAQALPQTDPLWSLANASAFPPSSALPVRDPRALQQASALQQVMQARERTAALERALLERQAARDAEALALRAMQRRLAVVPTTEGTQPTPGGNRNRRRKEKGAKRARDE
ncbi:hypothetical protein ACHAXT_001980 [Thalassiosira profunda]